MNRAFFSAPNGDAEERSWVGRAELRELTGYDERFISEGRGLSPLALMIALLERVVTFRGDGKSSTKETLGGLSIGECVKLMLALRKVTLGDRLSCELACPECDEDISVELSVDELLNQHGSGESESVARIDNFLLELRPVTADDVETLSLHRSQRGLAERLVRSCVVSSEPPLPEKLADETLTEIASELEKLDSGAETMLRVACPSCARPFQAPFAIEDFFLQEMESRYSRLEYEIHLLALNYHWSEDAILTMPSSRRKQYVEMINRDFYGEGE